MRRFFGISVILLCGIIAVAHAQIIKVQPRLIREYKLPNSYAKGGFVYDMSNSNLVSKYRGEYPIWFFDGSKHILSHNFTGETNIFDLNFKLIEHLKPSEPFSLEEIFEGYTNTFFPRFKNGDYLVLISDNENDIIYKRFSVLGKEIGRYDLSLKQQDFKKFYMGLHNGERIQAAVIAVVNDNDIVVTNYANIWANNDTQTDIINNVDSVILSTGEIINTPKAVTNYVISEFLKFRWTRINLGFSKTILDILATGEGYILKAETSSRIRSIVINSLIDYFNKLKINIGESGLFFDLIATETGFRVKRYNTINRSYSDILYIDLIQSKVFQVEGVTPYTSNTIWDDAAKRAWVYHTPDANDEILIKEYALDFLN